MQQLSQSTLLLLGELTIFTSKGILDSIRQVFTHLGTLTFDVLGCHEQFQKHILYSSQPTHLRNQRTNQVLATRQSIFTHSVKCIHDAQSTLRRSNHRHNSTSTSDVAILCSSEEFGLRERFCLFLCKCAGLVHYTFKRIQQSLLVVQSLLTTLGFNIHNVLCQLLDELSSSTHITSLGQLTNNQVYHAIEDLHDAIPQVVSITHFTGGIKTKLGSKGFVTQSQGYKLGHVVRAIHAESHFPQSFRFCFLCWRRRRFCNTLWQQIHRTYLLTCQFIHSLELRVGRGCLCSTGVKCSTHSSFYVLHHKSFLVVHLETSSQRTSSEWCTASGHCTVEGIQRSQHRRFLGSTNHCSHW